MHVLHVVSIFNHPVLGQLQLILGSFIRIFLDVYTDQAECTELESWPSPRPLAGPPLLDLWKSMLRIFHIGIVCIMILPNSMRFRTKGSNLCTRVARRHTKRSRARHIFKRSSHQFHGGNRHKSDEGARFETSEGAKRYVGLPHFARIRQQRQPSTARGNRSLAIWWVWLFLSRTLKTHWHSL